MMQELHPVLRRWIISIRQEREELKNNLPTYLKNANSQCDRDIISRGYNIKMAELDRDLAPYEGMEL